jgi:hypothetical protein
MRKPRDFDSALKNLADKAKNLQQTKRRQLGELIVATGADTLDIETLAGTLIAAVQSTDATQKQTWKKAGGEFFRKAKTAQNGDAGQSESSPTGNGFPSPPRSTTSKN